MTPTGSSLVIMSRCFLAAGTETEGALVRVFLLLGVASAEKFRVAIRNTLTGFVKPHIRGCRKEIQALNDTRTVRTFQSDRRSA